MSLQAIETTPNDGKPVFLVDQDTGDMTAAHWAARQGVSFQTEGASIGLSATHWRLARKTGERLRRVIARGSVIAEVRVEHALERGCARAAFMLAETCDARVLRPWRVRGISGDPAKARELYERAHAGGIEDAKERIETLK